VRLVTGDRCAGLVNTVSELLPQARYQRCMVHFMRNVLAKVSPRHTRWAGDALKAVFAMESRESALAKAEQVATEMEERKLREAAKCLREGIDETTTYLLKDYPVEHRRRIRTNTMIRTIEPGDPQENPRGGRFPGW
jgi:transposase-like protein